MRKLFMTSFLLRFLVWILVATPVSIGVGIAGSAPTASTPCTLPGVDEDLRCATVNVAENRDGKNSKTIPLFVVIIPALDPSPAADPWVELVGGPGNAATDFAKGFTTDLKAYRKNRDVLLVDQRGTGRSNGLYCEELSLHRVSSLFPRFPLNEVETCRRRLAEVADLNQYNSRQAALDLEEVRAALGYSRLNLFGSSYGTRVALEYLHLFPGNVRSMMLWGVVPPGFDRPLYYSRDGQLAFDYLVELCREDGACNAEYPALRTDLSAAMKRIKSSPVEIDITNAATGKTHQTMITQAGFAQAIWVALSVPARAVKLPEVIASAARGNFNPLIAMDVAVRPPRRTYFNGMHLSVVCAEETGQLSRKNIRRLYKNTFMPFDRAFEYLDACKAWNVAETTPAQLDVKIETPVLLISGKLDPITPPIWGDRAQEDIPNSKHIIIPQLSHESDGLVGAECLDRLFLAFVDDPDLARLDTSCIAGMRLPAFGRESTN